MRDSYDVIVVGCGVVGAALAYGMLGQGLKVLALDGTDSDARAAKANFGLVGAQGKGTGAPAYQRLSCESIGLWPGLAAKLLGETGIDVEYQNKGLVKFCLSEKEYEIYTDKLVKLNNQVPELQPIARMVERAQLEALLPHTRLGPKVVGAGLGIRDGHCNPLKLLRAFHQAIVQRGGRLVTNRPVSGITPSATGGFRVQSSGPNGAEFYDCERVVIAAGLGSQKLGAMVGLDVPVHAQRGQILVTERVAPMLSLPASGIRQTVDGTIMIGVTQEDVGMDLSTTTSAAAKMARRATQILPDLLNVKLIRQWACLRVMTPDSFPVYAESALHRGAWVALCHSGITLAAYHAGPLADAFARSRLAASLDSFHHRRFDVSQVI